MDLTKIKSWPGWSAVRLIGEGSFGKVYEIVRNHFGIEEHSALKVITIPPTQAELQSLKNDGMSDAEATEYYRGLVEEFVQEIALMSRLKGDPNIVSYEDYAVTEHTDSVGWDILIRMELLTDLPSRLRQHPMSARDVIKLGIDLCSALENCQQQKIIHRDIKPDNIFVSQSGDYKLGDFGVARTIEKTVSGLSKKGTYTYMAPEVYKGEEYGASVDLYSLGIVMYKLLNDNREPFLPPHPQPIKYADKSNALNRRIGGEIIPPPANASAALSAIVLKACAYRAEDRYASPTQMKQELLSVLHEPQAEISPRSEPVVPLRTADGAKAEKTVSMQPFTADPIPSAVPVSSAPTPPFGNPGNLPGQTRSAPPAKGNGLWIAGTVIGWIGFVFWLFAALFAPLYLAVQTIGILVTQLLFTMKKPSKLAAILMMVCSIFSLAILNLAVSVLYLILCNAKTRGQSR